jgi:hypothetical protein
VKWQDLDKKAPRVSLGYKRREALVNYSTFVACKTKENTYYSF